jgi:2,4-dienoyl-CoA reductase-like NADH-dependent reductase (Old Yellow Enzyme family)/thioredoxin reductase
MPYRTASWFPTLFSPLSIGSRTVPNRIMSSAHETGYLRDGMLSERTLAYYRERAAGGAGIVVAGPVYVGGDYGTLKATDPRLGEWLRRLAAELSEYPTLLLVQITHPGRQGSFSGGAAPLHLAPSPAAGRRFGHTWRIPHEMSGSDIRQVIGDFAQAAEVVMTAGIDGVELQYAHGNLVDQFLSTSTNTRGDEWGGDVEGRLSFPLRVLEAVRERVGSAFVLGARITGADFGRDATPRSERLEIAGHLDASGMIDYLSVTTGHYSDGLNSAKSIPDMSFKPAADWRAASDIAHLVGVPVASACRINHPALAEELLSTSRCDLVAVARALVADPLWPQKALAGQVEEIRPCVGALEGCQGNVYAGRPMRCVYNPVVGRELEWQERPAPAAERRDVLIIGGGPAGLECARVCASRGHRVTLLEQSQRLGGQLALAGRAPLRSEWLTAIDWLAAECERGGVDIRCGVRTTRNVVRSLRAGAVVVATGASEGRLDVPRHHTADVRGAWQVLVQDAPVTGRFVVIDQAGDRLGSSAAEHLASGGAEVTVITPMIYPGQAIDPLSWHTLHERLVRLGVSFHTMHEAVQIDADAVVVEHILSGQRSRVPADVVVTAALPTANDALYRELVGVVPRLTLVGDAVAPRGLEHATFDGHAAALEI